MRFTFWLLIAHTLGILVAVVSSVIEIESIMVSGPILSLSGALIAFLSFRRDRLLGFFFGLAAPTVATFWFFIIVTLKWDPGEAQVPVSTFLVVFGLLCIPACALVVLEVEASGNARPRAFFQFSIAGILVLTLALALLLGFSVGAGIRGAAAGISLAYLVICAYVAVQFFKNRRECSRFGRASTVESYQALNNSASDK